MIMEVECKAFSKAILAIVSVKMNSKANLCMTKYLILILNDKFVHGIYGIY